jgi:hypothetical protein
MLSSIKEMKRRFGPDISDLDLMLAEAVMNRTIHPPDSSKIEKKEKLKSLKHCKQVRRRNIERQNKKSHPAHRGKNKWRKRF